MNGVPDYAVPYTRVGYGKKYGVQDDTTVLDLGIAIKYISLNGKMHLKKLMPP